jgi:hypothetical protein
MSEDFSSKVVYPVDVEFSVTKRCGKPRNKKKWGKKLSNFFQSSVGVTLLVMFFVGLSVFLGVLCCPHVVMNVRAKLLRKNFRYKRVKLEEEERCDLTEEGNSASPSVEMRSRRRGGGADDDAVATPV